MTQAKHWFIHLLIIHETNMYMKGINKISTLVLLLGAMLLALTSCGGEKPKDVAKVAIQAEIDGDFEQLYNILCTKDREAVSLENFMSFYTIPQEIKGALDLIPAAREIIKAEGFKETVIGEEASVMFKLTLPNTKEMGKLSVSDLQSLAGLKWNSLSDLPEELQEKIKADVESNGVPKREVSKQIKLVREEDEWKVSLDLAKQISDGKVIKSIFFTEE